MMKRPKTAQDEQKHKESVALRLKNMTHVSVVSQSYRGQKLFIPCMSVALKTTKLEDTPSKGF